jgi:hypothetical protein
MTFPIYCCQRIKFDILKRHGAHLSTPLRDPDAMIKFSMFDNHSPCSICQYNVHVNVLYPLGYFSAATLPADVVVHAPNFLYSGQCQCIRERQYRALRMKTDSWTGRRFTITLFCVQGNDFTYASNATLDRMERELFPAHYYCVRQVEDSI